MKIAAVVITSSGREELCRTTIESLRATDWPETWPIIISRDEAVESTRQHRQQMNALTALRAVIELEPQFILFLEDDVVFSAYLSHNLTQWRPLRDGSLDTARFIAAHWHEIEGMQDIKMSRLAARGGWPIYYHSPSLVQHIGRVSTWGGGYHYAPDFEPQFQAS
jgi:hypothetical protein